MKKVPCLQKNLGGTAILTQVGKKTFRSQFGNRRGKNKRGVGNTQETLWGGSQRGRGVSQKYSWRESRAWRAAEKENRGSGKKKVSGARAARGHGKAGLGGLTTINLLNLEEENEAKKGEGRRKKKKRSGVLTRPRGFRKKGRRADRGKGNSGAESLIVEVKAEKNFG